MDGLAGCVVVMGHVRRRAHRELENHEFRGTLMVRRMLTF